MKNGRLQDRLGIDFRPFWWQSWSQKSLKFIGFYKVSWKFTFLNKMCFGAPFLINFEPIWGAKWSPKGAEWSPNFAPNGAPKRLRKLDRKKDAAPRERGEHMGPKRAPFSEPCGVFWANFSMFFQGWFLIDFSMVFGLIWGPFLGMFLLPFRDFVKFCADRVLSWKSCFFIGFYSVFWGLGPSGFHVFLIISSFLGVLIFGRISYWFFDVFLMVRDSIFGAIWCQIVAKKR